MTKKNYETPSLELMLLETCNVICSSGKNDYDVDVNCITDLPEYDWSKQGNWE